MITLVRCDDRLIHGQCMTRIVPHYKIKDILVVDDMTANNSLLKSIFEKAVPPNMSATVSNIQEASEKLEDYANSKNNTLILVKSPKTAYELFKSKPELIEEFMIGPVAMKNNAKEMRPGTYLLPEEIDALENLYEMNVEIFFQVIPENKKTLWKEIRSKYI